MAPCSGRANVTGPAGSRHPTCRPWDGRWAEPFTKGLIHLLTLGQPALCGLTTRDRLGRALPPL